MSSTRTVDTSTVEKLAQLQPLPLCYVIAGVSGSGKSTVGKLLADRLACPFFDGDDFHPAANKDKMRAGVALTDEDRWPWLQALAAVISDHVCRGTRAVVACSALKRAYREKLLREGAGGDADKLLFVLLLPPREELQRRVQARWAQGSHFMPPSLLDSQLNALMADIETSVTEEISGPLAAPGVHAARDVAPMVVLRKLAGPEQLVNIVLSYTGQQTLSAT